jgi:hypothetical protein
MVGTVWCYIRRRLGSERRRPEPVKGGSAAGGGDGARG